MSCFIVGLGEVILAGEYCTFSSCISPLYKLSSAPFPLRKKAWLNDTTTNLHELPQHTDGRRALPTRAHLCDFQNAISAPACNPHLMMAAMDGVQGPRCYSFGLRRHILSRRERCVRFFINLLLTPFPLRTKLNPLPQRTNPGRCALLTRAHLRDLQNAISVTASNPSGNRSRARRSIWSCT